MPAPTTLELFTPFFVNLTDPRIDRSKRHPLLTIIILAVCGTLGFQLGLIRLPLLRLGALVRLSLFELFTLATLVLLDLLFLSFADKPFLQELVTQVLHRPPPW